MNRMIFFFGSLSLLLIPNQARSDTSPLGKTVALEHIGATYTAPSECSEHTVTLNGKAFDSNVNRTSLELSTSINGFHQVSLVYRQHKTFSFMHGGPEVYLLVVDFGTKQSLPTVTCHQRQGAPTESKPQSFSQSELKAAACRWAGESVDAYFLIKDKAPPLSISMP